MKYKILSVALALGPFINHIQAQTKQEIAIKKMKDSLTLEGLSVYAQRYPLLRQGFLAYDMVGNGNIQGELQGKDLFKGKVNVSRIRSNFNIPVARWGTSLISGSIGYQQQRFETTQITSYNPSFSNTDFSTTKSTLRLAANISRADTLFNIPMGYSFGIAGVTDELSSIKRINYLATVTVPLSRTATSSWTVGAVVIIDPSAVSPFIPIISYWHKFKEPNVELFVDLPSRVAVRKQLSKRSWTTLGSELGGTLMFFDINQPGLPQNNTYSNAEIRTGATFEYLATKRLVLGINGGLFTTASNRMFARNDKPTDYFYKSSNGSSPYISFSISFLPFLQAL